jgi:hypothetical protein
MTTMGVDTYVHTGNNIAVSWPEKDIYKLTNAVNQIRTSKNKLLDFITLLPNVANLIMVSKHYEPIIDVRWNGSHFIFLAVYPYFINRQQEILSTHKLSVRYCLPIVYHNKLSRCYRYSVRPYLVAKRECCYTELDNLDILYHTNKTKIWWTPMRYSLIPNNAISYDEPSMIEIDEQQAKNHFSYMLYGNYLFCQRGVNIELVFYNSSRGRIESKGLPEVEVLHINEGERVFVYNKSSGIETFILGHNYIHTVYHLNIEDSEFLRMNILSSILNFDDESLSKIVSIGSFIFSKLTEIIAIVIVLILTGLVIYLITIVKPFCCC